MAAPVPARTRIVAGMYRARSHRWFLAVIVAVIVAASAAGCGVERYATFEIKSGGDILFIEGPVSGRLDASWNEGVDRFALQFDAGAGPLPDIRDVTMQIDWVPEGGRRAMSRVRCAARRWTCEVADPKGAPDDMVVEVSFTLVDSAGSSRRITRKRTLHREWNSYFWILRDC
jgi:hypothetical protein